MDLDEISLDNRPVNLLEEESPDVIPTAQPSLAQKENRQLSRPQTPGRSSRSPNVPTSDIVTPYSRPSTKRPYRKLVCRMCSKKVSKSRSCHGKSGESCNSCLRGNLRCSLLEPRPFLCKFCGFDYSTESSLRGHVTASHSSVISGSMARDVSTTLQVAESNSNIVNNIRGSSIQQFNVPTPTTSKNQPRLNNNTPRPEEAEAFQSRLYSNLTPNDNHRLAQVNTFSQLNSVQASQLVKHNAKSSKIDTVEGRYGTCYQGWDHASQQAAVSTLKPYNELHFEIFDTYEMRNLSPDYVQKTLNGIRVDIEQYGEFLKGNDKGTSTAARERLRFLDEVEPLGELSESDNDEFEIFGAQNRLVVALRSMFAVKDGTSLEEALEKIGSETQLLKLPIITRAVVAYFLLQIFTERDLLKEAELKAIELTHGSAQAANTVQHARLIAQSEPFFQVRLKNRAKKLANSVYDLIRPLTHWEQDSLHNGNQKQHLEKLRDVIFAGLNLAAELDARKGTFRFDWPRPGEQFDPSIHNDEHDENDSSNSKTKKNNRRGEKKVIAITLMPGVFRMLDNKELQYAKATVVVASPGEFDRY